MSIPLAKFTTYLGSLVNSQDSKPLNGRPMNLKTLQINPLVSKDILGNYEAVLTFCCYISRLNYENRPRKLLKAYKLLEFSPLVFNKGLSTLTYSKSTDTMLESANTTQPCGFLLYDAKHDNPLSITLFDYTTAPSLLFGKEKVIVVSFRGTLSIQSTLKDLNAIYGSLFNLFGKDLFSEEATTVEQRGPSVVNPFGAHRGFVNGLENVFMPILEKLTILLKANPDVSRIFVTGHSLGGAFASITGLGLAQLKKKGTVQGYPELILPPIHIVTFGAPKIFTDYSRNVFNDLLLGGFMTLDRIANRPRFPDPTMLSYDPIPLIPPNMSHPGFMILKPEIKTQSRTGRTKHSSELRDELAGIKAKKSLFTSLTSRNYNPLPDYPEFFKQFKDSIHDPSFTVDEYSSLLSTTVTGTVRSSKGSAKKVIDIVKRIFGISDADIEESAKSADLTVAKATQELKTIIIPTELGKEEAETAKLVNSQYKAAGETEPIGGAWFSTQTVPTVEPVGMTVKENSNTKKYKDNTVASQPNHIVYSCSQITAPIPGIGCHLGYMGVSFVGGSLNAGSGTVNGARDYVKEAILYCTNGVWTYMPDKAMTSTSTSNVVRGGNYSRKNCKSRKYNKSRKSRKYL